MLEIKENPVYQGLILLPELLEKPLRMLPCNALRLDIRHIRLRDREKHSILKNKQEPDLSEYP